MSSLASKIGEMYDGARTSIAWQTQRYDPLEQKLIKLFGQDEILRYQRIVTWIAYQGGRDRIALEKDYTEAQARHAEVCHGYGPSTGNEGYRMRENTGKAESMIKQNPNRQNNLEYITRADDEVSNSIYTGIVVLDSCDPCKKHTPKKEYKVQRGEKREYKTYDPIANDTLDINNAFDVQRAFLQALIGKAKTQTKQQEMYPAAYLM